MLRASVWVLVLSAASASADSKLPAFGVMADAGVPDGGTASIVYRPFSALRLHGGVGHNAISTGVRVGVTYAPFKTWFTPTVSVDYGHYPEGDANPVLRRFMGEDYTAEMLEHVGYDYANGHLGLAFGRKRFSFYLQAGMTRLTSHLYDDMTSVKLTMWSPSARLGFVLYVY
jgi:hypothetical protein